jgi:hypothetical protein
MNLTFLLFVEQEALNFLNLYPFSSSVLILFRTMRIILNKHLTFVKKKKKKKYTYCFIILS